MSLAWSETLKTGLLVEVQIISVIQFHSLKLTYCFFLLMINVSSDKVCFKRFDFTFVYMSIVSLCNYNAFRYGYTSLACCSNSVQDFKNVHSTLIILSKEVFSRRGSTVVSMKRKISCYAYQSQNLDEACILNHTGKCIRRFAGIHAYCRYFIDRM